MTSIDTDTGTLTETDTVTGGHTDYRLDDGDHERFSHYADKDKIIGRNAARMFGLGVS